MDATVDDFLKEINDIAPPKTKTHQKAVWKECYDESSGFAYYWNTQSDEVTWEMPSEYKAYKEQNPKVPSRKKMFVPPKTESLFPIGTLPQVKEDSVKIYKIGGKKQPKAPLEKDTRRDSETRKAAKRRRTSSESEDEKIVLISSYGGETESESEDDQSQISSLKTSEPEKSIILCPKLPPNPTRPPEHLDTHPNNKLSNESDVEDDDDDDTDLLTQIQNKAKVLKELGGELPEDVKKLVDDTSSSENVNFDNKDVTGFSLVAGYGEDTDEEDDETKTLFSVKENQVSHSILFPVTPSIDINQFATSKTPEKPPSLEASVDVKAFQRKRRIGIDLVNTQKNRSTDVPAEPNSERLGFGFKTANVEYPGFKTGGVMFVKSDVLHPPHSSEENHSENHDIKVDATYTKDDKLLKEIEDVQHGLGEKLKFLCEGHSPAIPVQVMIIQMETLYVAMKGDSLKPAYLKAWLKETCEELVKLEKEAAPSGWLLQWDRSHKRYYYHNRSSGVSQWEYPQPDIVRADDAMDICTTPPPPPSEEHSNDSMNMNMIVPPPPPRIKERSITPPPPPIISGKKTKSAKLKKSAKDSSREDSEPLPPGVDAPEVARFEPGLKVNQETSADKDTLSSALDSFYSDLASIEVPQPPKAEDVPKSEIVIPAIHEQPAPVVSIKKKKTKVKIAQGLAMKKKGVSKLVEKWKNVQKNYN